MENQELGVPAAGGGGNNNMVIHAASTILVILVVVLLLTCYLLVYFRHAFAVACFGIGPMVGGPYHQPGSPQQDRTNAGLSRAVIHTFPTYIYSDVKVHRLGNAELECAVCLNEFKDHEILRLLPSCQHVFHPHCIDKWLVCQATCPVCRSSVGPCNHLTGFQDCPDVVSEDDISVVVEPCLNQLTSNAVETSPAVRLGDVPKSHSTGHSPAWMVTDRFTLRLPEGERTKLAMTNDGRPPSNGNILALISSPRCLYRLPSGAWCNRMKTQGEYSDRFGKTKTFTQFVPFSGSPRSDGPVDYSSLVSNGVGTTSGQL